MEDHDSLTRKHRRRAAVLLFIVIAVAAACHRLVRDCSISDTPLLASATTGIRCAA